MDETSEEVESITSLKSISSSPSKGSEGKILKVKKPVAVIIDIPGIIARKEFAGYSNESKQFVKNNMARYLTVMTTKKQRRKIKTIFRYMKTLQQTGLAKEGPKLPATRVNMDQRNEAIMQWITYRLDNDLIDPATSLFQVYVMEWGYQNHTLKTAIYKEVPDVLLKWNKMNIRIYVANGSANFVNMVLKKTTSGDLTGLITGNINLVSFNQNKYDLNFSTAVNCIGIKEDKLLFLTRLPADAYAAKTKKVKCVLVVRKDFDPQLFPQNIPKNEEKEPEPEWLTFKRMGEAAWERLRSAVNVSPQHSKVEEGSHREENPIRGSKEVLKQRSPRSRESPNRGLTVNSKSSPERIRSDVKSNLTSMRATLSLKLNNLCERPDTPKDLPTDSGTESESEDKTIHENRIREDVAKVDAITSGIIIDDSSDQPIRTQINTIDINYFGAIYSLDDLVFVDN